MLFRSHENRRARFTPVLFRVGGVHRLRDAEIDEPRDRQRRVSRAEHDVLRLHVPVDDVSNVHRVQRRRNLLKNGQNRLRGQTVFVTRLTLKPLLERFPLRVPHDEKVTENGVLKAVQKRADVRVVQLFRQVEDGQNVPDGILVVDEFARKDLAHD